MQALVLTEKNFYREISFLPAAAVNSLEVQQAIGFKGQEEIPPRFPAARQLSADLRSKVSIACRVPGGKRSSAVFWDLAGPCICFGVRPLIYSCFHKDISSGVPGWDLGKPFGQATLVVSQRSCLGQSGGSVLTTAVLMEIETHGLRDTALGVFTRSGTERKFVCGTC